MAGISARGHLPPRAGHAYGAMAMTTPTVTETAIALGAVMRDDFADSPPSRRRREAPTQRDLVVLSLLRCPKLAAERRPG